MRFKPLYYLLGLILFPFVLAVQNPQINEPVHQISLTLVKPLLEAGHQASRSATYTADAFQDLWNTFREQGRMKSQMAELESRLILYNETIKENERLKKLIDFKKTMPVKTVAARLIGWDLSPWRKTVVLDKGKQDGIKKDMAVVVTEGLAGRVAEVGPATARVLLLVDPDSRVSAVTSQSRVQGVVEGDGSNMLKMSYLDLDAEISIGETVLSSGVGGLYPNGQVIGKIESISRDSNGLHLKANIKPFVRFTRLEEVLCLAFSRQE